MKPLSNSACIILFLIVNTYSIGLQHGIFRSQSTQGAAWTGTAVITMSVLISPSTPTISMSSSIWEFTTGGTAPDSFQNALEIVGNL